MANVVGRKSLKTIVLRNITPSNPLIRIESRNISNFNFTNQQVYSSNPEKIKEARDLVEDFADKVGINDLGAELADATGPAHVNPNDKADPWSRYTVRFINKDGKQMIFEGGGKIWDRLHVATNKQHWHPKGFFKLKEVRDLQTDN